MGAPIDGITGSGLLVLLPKSTVTSVAESWACCASHRAVLLMGSLGSGSRWPIGVHPFRAGAIQEKSTTPPKRSMIARRRWLVTGDIEILLSVFPSCTIWQTIAAQCPPRCSFLAIDLNIFRNAWIAEGPPGLTNGGLGSAFWWLCVDGKSPKQAGKDVGMSSALIPSRRSSVVCSWTSDPTGKP